jgi:hypothetical protein
MTFLSQNDPLKKSKLAQTEITHMKKTTLLLAALLLGGSVSAQLFSDDFESYALGSYLGPQSASWRTWSAGGEGTAEDVTITNNQASSGTQSIYFSSTAASGGPQDVVLLFGQLYNSGVFTFQSDFYVNAGKNAYFNFQGTQTIGQVWALNVNMDGGAITIDDGQTTGLATGSYSDNTWFTLKIEANLTLGIWKAYKDGNLFGQWENGTNAVASLNLYPIQNSQFFVDDVSFDHQTFTLPTLNAMVSNLNMGGNIATQVVDPVVTVKNAGQNQINSFDVVLDYNGTQYTENITGLSLNSLQNYNVTFNGITLAPGSNTANVTISNINGGTDNNSGDNVLDQVVNPVVPAAGKMVVGEEATGTWCVWCPRGAVFMDRFANDYDGFWAGIAVHGGSATEPMKVPAYESGITPLIAGFPSALVDRGSTVDPSQMSTQFFQRLQEAPVAFMTNGATWDAGTRTLNVSVTADFQSAANNNYKIACVLTEDGVTGTTSAYNQANAYAGGGNGVMGGYESLPNPVPASQMVYDHVARHIAPSFSGYSGSFPTTVNIGEEHTVNFTFVLPSEWDETNMHIVGMLIAPNGRIDNAGYTTITEAVSNGFVNGTSAGIAELNADQLDAAFRIHPNPASEFAVITIQLIKDSEVSLTVYDLAGKTISSRNYGTMSGVSEINLDTTALGAGVYLVEAVINGDRISKRLVIE